MRTQEVWGMLAAGPYLSPSLSLYLSVTHPLPLHIGFALLCF